MNRLDEILFDPPQISTLAINQIRLEQQGGQGLKLGLPQLDAHFITARPGKFIGVLAQTSHGKSSWMNFTAGNMTKQLVDDEIGIYATWEDTVEDFGITDLSSVSGVPMASVYSGSATEADFKKLMSAAAQRATSPLWVVGHSDSFKTASPRLTMTDILLVMENIIEKQKKNVRFIMFDYLQLVNLSDMRKDDRRVQFNDVIQAMRDLAKGYGLTAFCATQVKREVSDRKWSQPQINDAMETSGFEHACDAAISLWNVHRSQGWELGKVVQEGRNGELDITVTKELMLIETLKQKKGDAKIVQAFDFIPEYNHFTEYNGATKYRKGRA